MASTSCAQGHGPEVKYVCWKDRMPSHHHVYRCLNLNNLYTLVTHGTGQQLIVTGWVIFLLRCHASSKGAAESHYTCCNLANVALRRNRTS